MKSWIGGTSNPFSIDYSKRETAKCQKCTKNIGQDELRMGKSLPFKGKLISRYFHVPCVFAMFRKARVATCIVAHSGGLDGFDAINDEDKSYIIGLLETEVFIRSVKVIAPPKVYSATVENWSYVPSKNQKQKSSLESTNLHSLNVMFTNADQLTSSKMSEIKKHIENEKPMIVTVCEMKPKNARAS